MNIQFNADLQGINHNRYVVQNINGSWLKHIDLIKEFFE